MDWKTIEQEYPEYYQVVLAELKDGNHVLIWRASNGEKSFYTKYNSNQVFFEDEIIKWKKVSEKDIPKWEEI